MSTVLTPPPPVERPAPPAPPERLTVPRSLERPARLTALDAYRGFIMLAMASAGFGLAEVAKHFPDSRLWAFIGYHTDHVDWVGCGFWDLIQPAFMFMAGVAIPYSYASRKAKGDSDALILFHVAVRSLALVLLGVFLSSNSSQAPGHLLVNVLSQIGLGYFFVYLLRGRGLAVQLAAAAVVLVGYWLWFALYPLPPADFNYASVGLDDKWGRMTGFFAHWEKNANAASAFDVWLLNLFPAYHATAFSSSTPVMAARTVGLLGAPMGGGPLLAAAALGPGGGFYFNPGGYQTLNFIPSMATMIFGLTAGELLRGPKSGAAKFAWLAAAGLICLEVGLGAGLTVCPIVKRIWTPSWAVYSAGWTFWMLAAFYAVCDLKGWKGWAFPLTVVGMNSIAIYCMSQLLRGPIKGTFRNVVGEWWIEGWLGSMWLPTVQLAVILAVLWLACLWMYNRKIFVRI